MAICHFCCARQNYFVKGFGESVLNTFKKFLFILTSCLGICAIALTIIQITGVSVCKNDENILLLSNNSGTNAVSINGSTIVTTDIDPQIVFDVTKNLRFKYVEINLSNAIYTGSEPDAADCQILYAYSNHDFVHEQAVWQDLKVGRNFIALPDGDYSAIRIDLTQYGGATFKIDSINLTSKLPLRFRHIFAFLFFGTLWCVVCWIMFSHRLSFIIVRLQGLKKYSYLLFNLVKKDFTTKYRRSVLGVLWSVLNPLLMAMVISAVFSTIFRAQIENFVVYYLTGSLIFNFMSEATSGSLGSIICSAGLIKKVYIPKYIFPLEKCLFALVNTMFSFIATVILMPFLGVPLKFTVLLFWVPLIYVFVFSVGLGMLLSATNVFFRDVGHLYGVWIMAWMYLTPVLYPKEIIPIGIQWLTNANPMYYYVDYFRSLMMYNTIPDFKSNIICASFSVAFLIVGLIVFKWKQDKFILYI
ncbi:MAG: ABC transporter permease [Hydrogenoanaerobacterium sp.]